jgi:hypothetical protein
MMVAVIGNGGTAIVGDGDGVAAGIKLCDPHRSQSDAALQRASREAESMRSTTWSTPWGNAADQTDRYDPLNPTSITRSTRPAGVRCERAVPRVNPVVGVERQGGAR